MNKYKKAIDEFFKTAPAIYVDRIHDGGDRYLFRVNDKTNPTTDPLDPWYIIDKKSLKIQGFLPHTNIKWFNNTLQNEVKSFI